MSSRRGSTRSWSEGGDPASRWPLHWQVWHNDAHVLKRLLLEKQYDKEEKDPRGRTPLHLAVALQHIKCVGVLLSFGANTLAVNRHQWNVLHEAVTTANVELIGMVLCCYDRQKQIQREQRIPVILDKLTNSDDFYIEMKWQFSSWIPFMTRLCPSDTYKIWKRGTTVRVDNTLVGFQNLQWLRGEQSNIFEAKENGALMIMIDHQKKTVLREQFSIQTERSSPGTVDHAMGVARRLSSPVVTTIIDTDDIGFQRHKSGIWGFRTDRTEIINGYEAKVFTATGLSMVTRTRMEHLPENNKKVHKDMAINPLQGLLQSDSNSDELSPSLPSHEIMSTGKVAQETLPISQQLTVEEYFTKPANPKQYDGLGAQIDMQRRVQQIKANVWLCEDYPLSLEEQILPIIDLMAINDAHFNKVKDFITLQMPSGFPIRFEVPLFHVMSAKVTFGNINGHNSPVPYLSLHSKEKEEVDKVKTESATPTKGQISAHGDSEVKCRHVGHHTSTTAPQSGSQILAVDTVVTMRKELCMVSDEAFAIPDSYLQLNQWRGSLADEEEEMLQQAIRKSLMEQGSTSDDQQQLSLMEMLTDLPSTSRVTEVAGKSIVPQTENDYELAVALSETLAAEDERRRHEEEEEEELQRVIKLSLADK